ncbi:MAG: EVE domain-containing protein, partial [Alphaproteobacteria bacterium]
LKSMKVGERAFFYHSNEGLEIVGIAEIVREAYPDPSDPAGRFVMVDLSPVMPVKTPVTLKQMKADPALADMQLIKQSRLSVCPVTDDQWRHICGLAGVAA